MPEFRSVHSRFHFSEIANPPNPIAWKNRWNDCAPNREILGFQAASFSVLARVVTRVASVLKRPQVGGSRIARSNCSKTIAVRSQ
jgi:hypothetical protein